jgi:hypothetical protein
VAVASLSTLSACRLQDASGQIGLECKDAGDCDDSALGCVPVDVDNPGRGKACMPPPEGWICQGDLYGDDVCDCGCAVLDLDCPNELASSCGDNGNQCPEGQDPVNNDNTQCA